MTKIKLSLPSGSEVEKSVLSYFNNGGNYLVLDAESVGSMGLPIILVSKVTDKVEKIADQTEWQQVKGFLKNIISGGQTNYLAIPESMSADESFYTQLTLPVASFDSLKNNYVAPAATEAAPAAPAAPAPEAPAAEAVPVVNSTAPATENTAAPATPAVAEPAPVEPVIAAPTPEVPSITPEVEAPSAPNEMQPVNMSTEAPEPIVEAPVPTIEEPIANEGLNAAQTEAAPAETPLVVETPAIATPEIPAIEAAPQAENTATTEQPIIEAVPLPAAEPSKDVSEIKQRFMKACEDLFDSLSSLK